MGGRGRRVRQTGLVGLEKVGQIGLSGFCPKEDRLAGWAGLNNDGLTDIPFDDNAGLSISHPLTLPYSLALFHSLLLLLLLLLLSLHTTIVHGKQLWQRYLPFLPIRVREGRRKGGREEGREEGDISIIIHRTGACTCTCTGLQYRDNQTQDTRCIATSYTCVYILPFTYTCSSFSIPPLPS